MLEEMRWLEYGQRVRREERGSIAGDLGCHLIRVATEGGAAALTAGGKPPLATIPVRMPASTAAEGTWMYSLGEGSIRPYRGN
jgi:cytosine/adenosine deaminase-related metal-dependent hydrolase